MDFSLLTFVKAEMVRISSISLSLYRPAGRLFRTVAPSAFSSLSLDDVRQQLPISNDYACSYNRLPMRMCVCICVTSSICIWICICIWLCIYVCMSAFGCAVCPLTECAFVLMPEQQKCISTQVSLKAKGFFCVRANLWASLYLCVCVCVCARFGICVHINGTCEAL